MNNKLILVTGVTSGVGRCIAEHYSAVKGYTVVGLSRNRTILKTLSSSLGGRFEGVQVDISDSEALGQFYKEFMLENKKIDYLINNAAIFENLNFNDSSLESIDKIIDTNLKGTMYNTFYALKSMGAGSRIINISSVAGLTEIPGQSIYCASKHGLLGFAGSLAQELKDSEILITNICPGGINTSLWDEKTNPYKGGELESILSTNDILKIIQHILELPNNVILKEVCIFPKNEWH